MQHEPESLSQDAPRLLFVVGLWRSGTSLAHALLNRHPQIALLYEAEPLELWPRSGGLFPMRDWPRRLEFYNQTFTRHKLDPRRLASTPPGPDGVRMLYREYASGRNATVMGEKAPSYYARLPALGKLFPDAQFVIIWRDPLECCRSAKRAARQNRFFAQRGMAQRMLLGAETLARGVEELLREKRSVCEVVYDDLVKDTEGELRRVCDFLKIPFAPAMLDLKSADTSSVPSGEHHVGVRSGVIGKAAEATEVLPAAFVAKGRRYAKLWRARFSKLAFARALAAPAEVAPGLAERLADTGVRVFWRGTGAFKHFLFRRIPLSWWARLRSTTPRAQTGQKTARD